MIRCEVCDGEVVAQTRRPCAGPPVATGQWLHVDFDAWRLGTPHFAQVEALSCKNCNKPMSEHGRLAECYSQRAPSGPNPDAQQRAFGPEETA